MTLPEPAPHPDDIRHRWLLALAVYALATLALCWPMLLGQFAVTPLNDQFSAGFGFREFGAAWTRTHGALPQWNPWMFGGLPFIAAMHGDIFYPTAWLRLVLPVDTAMNLGFALHLLLAGVAMHAFLRSLRFGFGPALVGGLAYQLTGIVASLIHPGHDGKLFVSALAPLVLLAITRAVRDGKVGGYGALALLVGLCMVSPHYQLTYYLLVAAGLWTLWLVFLSPERAAGSRIVPLACALAAVVLGVAISAVQALPFLEYIQFSPRGAGGSSSGWEYATSYSLPPAELMTAVLPDFNGVIEHYWGENPIKLHTEYLGVVVVALAALAWGNRARRRELLALGAIGVLFLLIALGEHTPFYRLWYALMPMMKSVRAPGMAFFLVALPVAVWAAAGAERVFRREAPARTVLGVFGALAALGVLGVVGMLQAVAEGLADPRAMGVVAENAGQLHLGSIQLLVAAVLGGAVAWAITTGRLAGLAAVLALAGVVGADLWAVDRRFFRYSGPAEELFASDPIIARMQETTGPFRVLDYSRVIGMPPAYDPSHLMPHRVQDVIGYHGNEIRYYDDLLGGKNVWRHLQSPRLWDLLAVQYVLMPDTVEIPGFRRVLPPTLTALGRGAVLYEREGRVPYARVIPGAAKVPEEQLVPTLMDPRFPLDRVVLLPDTASVTPAPLGTDMAPVPEAGVAVTAWDAGSMALTVDGALPQAAWLLVSENWYPDWRATVDGNAVPVHRGDGALMAIELPAGARQVELVFRSDRYALGRLVSLVGLLTAAGLILVPVVRGRGAARG